MTTQPSRPRWRPRPSAVEFLVYRYGEITRRGLKRQLLGNYTAQSDLRTALQSHGVGRYRVEYRDRRRQVVEVLVFTVLRDLSVKRARPLKKPRKLPPPMHLPRAPYDGEGLVAAGWPIEAAQASVAQGLVPGHVGATPRPTGRGGR